MPNITCNRVFYAFSFSQVEPRSNKFFDGTDDYIEIPNSSELSSMGTLSVQAWVKKTSNPSSGVIIYKGGSNGLNVSYGLEENEVSNSIIFLVKNFSGTSSTSFDSDLLTLNTWHHIVGVYKDSFIKIYVLVICGLYTMNSWNLEHSFSFFQDLWFSMSKS